MRQRVGQLFDGYGDAFRHAGDVGKFEIDEADATPLHLSQQARLLIDVIAVCYGAAMWRHILAHGLSPPPQTLTVLVQPARSALRRTRRSSAARQRASSSGVVRRK